MDDRSGAARPAEEPLACSLRGDDLANRRSWLAEIAERALAVERSARGVTATFPNDAALEAELRALAEAEAECCAFLSIEVRRADGVVELDVAGPTDAQPIIDEMLGASPR
jgi:hypothetical protein